MRGPARAAALVVVVLAAAGCLTTSEVLVDRPWKLVEIAGAPPVDPEGVVGVRFGTDGRFTVNTGCNTTGGTYHLDGNQILLDTVQQTLVLCDGDLATQEARVLAVVKNAPAYAIDTGTGRLRLTSDAGQILLFEAP